MQFTIEDVGATKKKLAVEVPADTVQAEVDKIVGVLRKQAKIKGFRPGKVPVTMIKRLFQAQIEQEVVQTLMNDNLPEALEQTGLPIVSPPALEDSSFSEGEPFRFTVSFEVRPEFELSGYENLALTQKNINVTDEMVDNKLEEVRQANASTKSPAEVRPLQNGDMAVIDYKAFVGDEPLEGGANPNYQLELGSGRFHPDFEKELIGMSIEEDKTITVTFPTDHFNPKLASREVRFEVSIIDIKEKLIPELNDEFAKDLGREDIDTLDKLKQFIREDLTAEATRRSENEVHQQARDKLLDLVEFEVPESAINAEMEAMVKNTMLNLKRSGLSMEAMGLSEAKLRDDYRPEAEKRVRFDLILDRIAKNHDITVSDEEIDEEIGRIAGDTGQSPEAIREIYNKNNMMDALRADRRKEKTLKYIIDNATIEYVDPSESADTPEAGSNGAEEE